ncbi:PHOS protein, partial [Tricholaema leucomelas]|nr:PHOS protein [Tricholaema leucomelas]
MEENAKASFEEDFEGQATHTGKETNHLLLLNIIAWLELEGIFQAHLVLLLCSVINDWRKFKLESEDRDSLSLSKKEILRQMSSPHRCYSKDDKDTRERFCRKV